MKKLTFALLLGSTMLAPAAQAAPLLWRVSDVAFGDGSTAPRTFDYDADVNSYSHIDITTTAGPALPGETHTAYAPTAHIASVSALASVVTSLTAGLTGIPELLANPRFQNPTLLNPGLPLTNASRVSDADYAQESICAITTCDYWAVNDRPSAYAAFVSATAGLTPKRPIALLGVVLVGLAMMPRPNAVRSSLTV